MLCVILLLILVLTNATLDPNCTQHVHATVKLHEYYRVHYPHSQTLLGEANMHAGCIRLRHFSLTKKPGYEATTNQHRYVQWRLIHVYLKVDILSYQQAKLTILQVKNTLNSFSKILPFFPTPSSTGSYGRLFYNV